MPLGMELGLSPGDFVFDGNPAPPQKGGGAPPQFSAHVYCGQTAAWITMSLGTKADLGPDAIVLDGDPASPSPKGGRAPSTIFGPRLLWPNCWMDQGGTWHGGGPWSRPHCARWGHSSPPPILTHVYCGQTAGWIKTPLGTEVDLGPGHFVLDGFPAVGERGTAAPLFSAHAYCGHGRPSQLLLSSCTNCRPKIGQYLAKLWARLQWLPF